HASLPVIQIAELGGVYAVSLVIVAVNAALAGLSVLGWRRSAPGLAAAAFLLLGTLGFGWRTLANEFGPAADRTKRIEVAVIQPSIEQSVKEDPASRNLTLDIYERLTRLAGRSKPAIIIWPETAAPIFLRGDRALQDRLMALSREVGAPLLVGSIDRLP